MLKKKNILNDFVKILNDWGISLNPKIRKSNNIKWRSHKLSHIFLLLMLLVQWGLPQKNVTAEMLAAPVPLVSFSGVPSQVFIGEDFSFTISFDNNDVVDAGFGPFIDLVFPYNGADGAAGTDVADGIDFLNATYLGTSVTSTVQTFPDDDGDLGVGTTGCVNHPYALDTGGSKVQVCGTAGDKLVTLQLPFGSFTADQPAADIDVNASLSNLADLAITLPIYARGGFQYGADALNNPATDPSILSSADSDSSGWTPVSNITPFLIVVNKTNNLPEGETATGPNYPRRFTVTLDIPEGQVLNNVVLTDYLPNDLEYLSFISATPAGYTVDHEPLTGAPQNQVPDPVDLNYDKNELSVSWASITGGATSVDARFVFEFFAPEFDADGASIISPLSGGCVNTTNQAEGAGDWVPIDSPRDSEQPASDSDTDTIELCALAIQKHVSPSSSSPGGILDYSYDIQISDYFTIGGPGTLDPADTLTVIDVISDGQRFRTTDRGAAQDATFSFTDRNGTSSGNFDLSQTHMSLDESQNALYGGVCGDGSSTVTFDLSQLLKDINTSHPDAVLTGGRVGSDAGAATGTITYQTEVQDEYGCSPASGDVSIDQNDSVENSVDIYGAVLDNSTQIETGFDSPEDSAASVVMETGVLQKTIYARNGNTSDIGPKFASGDTITYRITYSLPSSDMEDFTISDYLPLPVLYADDHNADGTMGDAWVFDDPPVCEGGWPPTNNPPATAPDSGHYTLGPLDTFHCLPGPSTPGTPPSPAPLTVDGVTNSLTFSYGDYDNVNNYSSTVDILFTLTISSDPFADGMFLTNQARSSETNSSNVTTIKDEIIQFQLTQPVVTKVIKGVIETDHSGLPADSFSPSDPNIIPSGITVNAVGDCPRLTGLVNSDNLSGTFNSNLTNIDTGDRVTFAVVIENTGTGLNGIFDVRIHDTIPTGFIAPGTGIEGVNLCVTDGTGDVLPYTLNGAGFFGPTEADSLELTDAGPAEGSLSPVDSLSGENLAIITYDLIVDTQVSPEEVLTNTATLFNYGGAEGGADHTDPNNISDTAKVTVADPVLIKTLVSTEVDNAPRNALDEGVIGEVVTYTTTFTVPEGLTENAKIVDTLDAGLAFIGCDAAAGMTASAGVTSSLGVFTLDCSGAFAPTVEEDGHKVTFTLGDVTNSNTDNGVAETITLKYDAVVLNTAANQDGIELKNSAVLSWDVDKALDPASADVVTVVEPVITTSKSVVVNGSGTSGDAGDPVVYTLSMVHDVDTPDAYEVSLSDVLPQDGSGESYIASPAISAVNDSEGILTSGNFTITGSDAAGWILNTDTPFDITQAGRTIDIEITGSLRVNVTPGDIDNEATTEWSSLDGSVGPESAYNNDSTERTGAGGVNDYTHTSSASTLVIYNPARSKSLVGTEFNVDRNSNSQATIGELVYYRVVVTVKEGSLPNLKVTDTLDAGLAFVSCDSITASAGLSTSLGDFSLACQNDNSNPVLTSSGSMATFTLGDVVNSNTDNGVDETITIDYTAVVLNTSANQNGELRNNSAAVTWSTASSLTPASASNITLVEPGIDIDKTVVVNGAGSNGDAGDSVVYSITLSHSSGTPNAYEVNILDDLPVNGSGQTLISSPTISNVTDTEAVVNAASFQLSGNETTGYHLTTITPFDIEQDARTIVLEISGSLPTYVAPGDIENTAEARWTSLAGDVSSARSAYDANSVERDGTGGVNDYSVTDPVSLSVSSSATKSITQTSEGDTGDATADTDGDPRPLAVGEVVRYRVEMSLPEGISPALKLVDDLPAGISFLDADQVKLSFSADTDITEAADLSGADNDTVPPTFVLPSGRISQSGQTVTFDLGTLENNDRDLDNERLVLEFNALVSNTTDSNSTDVNKDNSIAVEVDGSTNVTSNVVSAKVVEPSISDVTKSFQSVSSSTVDYRLTFSNAAPAATARAYEVHVLDTMPAQLTLDAGSIQVSINGTPQLPASFMNNSDATKLDIVLPLLEIDDAVQIDYAANIIADGQTIHNEAQVSYTSLPNAGGTTGNATGSDTPGITGTITGERDGSGGVNDYAMSGTLSLGSIGDQVWFDVNGDGVQDAGEPGLSNVTLTLTSNGPDGLPASGDEISLSVDTDVNGNYMFNGLPAASYVLTVDDADLPAGVAASYDLDGTATAHVAANVALAAGENRTDVDFGYTGTGSIGDVVWLDLDGNKTKNGSEPGIPGAIVHLDWVGLDGSAGTADDLNLTVNTDASGAYLFDHLAAVDYTIWVDSSGFPANLAATNDTYDADLDSSFSYTLGAGQDFLEADFGYRGSSALGDLVWYDVNADGSPVSEPGLASVDVILTWGGLDDDLSTPADNVEVNASTDSSGIYGFSGLPSGNYRVTVDDSTLATGFSPSYDLDGIASAHQADVNLPGGATNLDVDFGYTGTGSIGDFVWNDLDGDGVQDGGETGFFNVTVDLYLDVNNDGTIDGGDTLLGTRTTDAAGSYDFTGLSAGNYLVTVTDTNAVLDGFVRTGGSEPHDGTLTAGQDYNDADFGYQQQNASIGDTVWNDANGDGIQNAGETGIQNVTVKLYLDVNNDGVIDGGDTDLGTQTTDASGAYLFSDLAAGDYLVTVTDDNNELTTFTLTGGTDPHDVALAAGQAYTDADFGYQQRDATIGDTVWLDINGDGLQDAGEVGIENVTLDLYLDVNLDGFVDVGDTYVNTQTTDANGNYDFTGMPAGQYLVTVTDTNNVLDGYSLSGGTEPHSVTLSAGQDYNDADFGYYGNATIGDFIWHDVNGDGVQDAAEPGLENVTVSLYRDVNNNGAVDGGDVELGTQTTDANGAYDFAGIGPGDYLVEVTDENHVLTSFVFTGGTNPHDVALSAGQDYNDADFGYQQQSGASIGDTVWYDTNGDGVQDSNEYGIQNVTLVLYRDNNDDGAIDAGDLQVDMQTTDADGKYDFSGLLAGNYLVMVTDTAGMLDGYSLTTAMMPYDVSLSINQDFNDADFGYVMSGTGTIGDYVWYDDNGDGIQDVTESGVSNVTLDLYRDQNGNGSVDDGDTNLGTITTDANGAYQFTNLMAGKYVVVVTDENGVLSGRSISGGTEPLPVTLSDGQNLDTADFGYVGFGKDVLSSSLVNTTDPEVVIGETVTFRIELEVRAGQTMTDVNISDIMPSGLAYRDCQSISSTSANLSASAQSGNLTDICANAIVSEEPAGSTAEVDQGRKVVWSFGDLENSGGTDESIIIDYRAVVLDTPTNQSGINITNLVTVQSVSSSSHSDGEPLTIVEPEIGIAKRTLNTIPVSNGDIVTYRITIGHSSASEADAFEVVLRDRVPDGLTYIPGSLLHISGPIPSSIDESAAPDLTVSWDQYLLSWQSSVIEFQAEVTQIAVGQTIINTAFDEWTSLPGDNFVSQSTHNILAVERWYDPPSPATIVGDDGQTSNNSATLPLPAGSGGGSSDNSTGGECEDCPVDIQGVTGLPGTGFQEGHLTSLTDQPIEKDYYRLLPGETGDNDSQTDLWLEIPELDIKSDVVGVPLYQQGWDVSWLAAKVGFLDGTAFPTWQGNTGLTGHVYLSDGSPGPFVHLYQLAWGDSIILHAWGEYYQYEVRSVEMVAPGALNTLGHKDEDWITLITCKEYDEGMAAYRWRVVAQAVLVSSQPEP